MSRNELAQAIIRIIENTVEDLSVRDRLIRRIIKESENMECSRYAQTIHDLSITASPGVHTMERSDKKIDSSRKSGKMV